MLNKYVGLSEEPVLIHYFTNTQCCNPTDTNQLCKKGYSSLCKSQP